MKTKQKSWFDDIWDNRRAFIGVSVIMMFMTYSVLYYLDFVPGATARVASDSPLAEEVVAPESPVEPMPVRIIIENIDVDVSVLNPTTRDVASLDQALLAGTVRHPDSADLSEDGTMFILGHSSFLPTVHNLNYRAFNNIQKLYWGDEIRVRSMDREYIYRVTRVYEAKASEAKVDLQWEKKMVVLATCNSFGSKDDRFVVEASFVESWPI